jgi:hypothetical protein
MAYNRKDLTQSDANTYDKIFHQTTTPNPTGRKVQNNDKIINYRMFPGQYELTHSSQFQSRGAADMFNENAKKNRESFQEQSRMSVNQFNQAIDSLHLPQDMNRPLATRDQIKDFYEDENKSFTNDKRTNDYFNQHQFMPSRVGNRTMSGFDPYNITFKTEKKNGYEELF